MKKLSLLGMIAFLGMFIGILSSCEDDKDDGRNYLDDKAGTFQVLHPQTGASLTVGDKISLTDGDTVKFCFQPKEEYQKERLVFKISCSELTEVDGSADLFVAKKGQLKVGDNTITVKTSLDGENGTIQIGNDTYTLSASTTYQLTLSEKHYLRVSRESVELLASGGGRETVQVESNMSWEATISDSWLKTSKNGKGELQIYAEDNPSTNARTGVVTISTITGEQLARDITVTQNGREQSTILFEAPYTVWGTSRSSVKTTMSSRGYSLAKESTSASDNYYLGYNGKYRELGSMYEFDKDMKLNEVVVMVQTSVANVSDVGNYLTSELGYIYVTSSNGSYGYASSDQKTLVVVSSQTISGQNLVIVTFVDVNQITDDELFEAPYTVWGTGRSNVKSTMSSRGYTLVDESTNASDNYYLGYEGKKKELLSMYMFNADIKLNQVAIMLQQSVANVSAVGEYLTSEFGYVYLTTSDGTDSYVSNDYSTVVMVSTQTANNQTLTLVTFVDINSLYGSTKKATKSQIKATAQKLTAMQPVTQMKSAAQKAFQKKIQRIREKTENSLSDIK